MKLRYELRITTKDDPEQNYTGTVVVFRSRRLELLEKQLAPYLRPGSVYVGHVIIDHEAEGERVGVPG
jgi:hypothetical protein